MKRFHWLKAVVPLVALFLGAGRGLAQIPGGTPAGMSAAMMKLFGPHPAFTAEVEASVSNPSGKPLHLTMTMACLDQKMRSEVDLSRVNGPGMPAQTVAQMKQLGMDRVVSIIRPDHKTIALIYPHLRAYAEMPLADAGPGGAELKMTKATLGQETVEGHSCVKSRVTFTDDKKQKQEIVVWNASDLKSFPVKMQMQAAGSEVTMLYKNVKFRKPEARQFEPPAGYTKYADQLQIMEKAAQRVMSSHAPANQKR